MSQLRAAYWVWRRELRVTLRGPIIYIVGGLFLLVQGLAFAALVGALSDPQRPAPIGALLEGQLAGTLLTWVLSLVVLTLLGMRTIAEERRNGGWEQLLTAGVGEPAAIVGTWLASATVYALLWLPTLAYLVVVAMFRVDSGGWDVATIVTGYTGAIALGAALLAWAIAASAATTSSLAAGALGFALLIGLFLLGELGTVWPGLAVDHPTIANVLAAIGLRAHVAALARGELQISTIVLFFGLAIVGLSIAITCACAGRRRRAEVRTRAAATCVLAAIAILAGVLAARHPARWDVSTARRNSLDDETRAIVAELTAPATLTIIEPTLGGLAPVFDEVARTAARMAESSRLLTVRRVDPAAAPGGLAAVARAAGLAPGDLAAGGAIIVDVGARRRVIDLLAIATVDRGPGEAPTVERLAAEQALAGALAELTAVAPLDVCATTGHGELPLATATASGADWTAIADRLRGDGATLEDVDDAALAAGVPARCSVVVVIGPGTPLPATDALAMQRYLAAGGGVLVAAASRPTAIAQLGATGLEGVLAADGLALPTAIVVDPELALDVPGALRVLDGYADHPINAGFARARATVWYQPRVVAIAPAPAVTVAVGRAHAAALVSAGPRSWGEVDLVHGPPTHGDDDLPGPVALAAVGATHRVIVLGSAESMSSAVLVGGASAGDLWVARAIRWLADVHAPAVAIAARAPAQVRLLMTPGERRAVIAVSTGGIPLAWGLIGGGLLWWRRRRAARDDAGVPRASEGAP